MCVEGVCVCVCMCRRCVWEAYVGGVCMCEVCTVCVCVKHMCAK